MTGERMDNQDKDGWRRTHIARSIRQFAKSLQQSFVLWKDEIRPGEEGKIPKE